MLLRFALIILLVAVSTPRSPVLAQVLDTARVSQAPNAWLSAPQQPLRIYGNTYYVGTHGVTVLLLTSSAGHVLIDGGLPESASSIVANIRTLGFRIEDVKLILNSHAHFDHAGGIAALQRASGALVAASPASALVLERGASGPNDPLYGAVPSFPAVSGVKVIVDGDTLRVGTLTLTAHFTPGHTPGGTSWSWRACENGRCVDLVYADSQTPVSADSFSFTRSQTYPSSLKDFEQGFAILEHLSCDVLITPHPGASELWDRLAARDQGRTAALVDPGACKRYVATARAQLAKRVAAEAAQP